MTIAQRKLYEERGCVHPSIAKSFIKSIAKYRVESNGKVTYDVTDFAQRKVAYQKL